MSKKINDTQRRESFIRMNADITASLGNSTTLPIVDSLFAELPLHEQFACLMYRMSHEPNISTNEILKKIVAYVAKDHVRPSTANGVLPPVINILTDAFTGHMKTKGAEVSTCQINDLMMVRHHDIGTILKVA